MQLALQRTLLLRRLASPCCWESLRALARWLLVLISCWAAILLSHACSTAGSCAAMSGPLQCVQTGLQSSVSQCSSPGEFEIEDLLRHLLLVPTL